MVKFDFMRISDIYPEFVFNDFVKSLREYEKDFEEKLKAYDEDMADAQLSDEEYRGDPYKLIQQLQVKVLNLESEQRKFKAFEHWVRNQLLNMMAPDAGSEHKSYQLKNGCIVPFSNLQSAARDNSFMSLAILVFGESTINQYFFFDELDDELKQAVIELAEKFAKARCLLFPDKSFQPNRTKKEAIRAITRHYDNKRSNLRSKLRNAFNRSGISVNIYIEKFKKTKEFDQLAKTFKKRLTDEVLKDFFIPPKYSDDDNDK